MTNSMLLMLWKKKYTHSYIYIYIYIIHTWSIMFNCIEAIILHYGQENKKHKHLLILEGNQKRKRKKS